MESSSGRGGGWEGALRVCVGTSYVNLGRTGPGDAANILDFGCGGFGVMIYSERRRALLCLCQSSFRARVGVGTSYANLGRIDPGDAWNMHILRKSGTN